MKWKPSLFELNSIPFTLGIAFLAGFIGGCKDPEPPDTPDRAVKKFMSAVERRDKEAIWNLLAPETKKQLKEWAEHLGTGNNIDFDPLDLISPAERLTTRSEWRPEKFKVLKQEPNRAVVEVSSPAPANAVFHMEGASLGFVAGSSESLHFPEKPEFAHVSYIPMLGLSIVATRDQSRKRPGLTAGRRQNVSLVRHEDRWRIKLNFDSPKKKQDH